MNTKIGEGIPDEYEFSGGISYDKKKTREFERIRNFEEKFRTNTKYRVFFFRPVRHFEKRIRRRRWLREIDGGE